MLGRGIPSPPWDIAIPSKNREFISPCEALHHTEHTAAVVAAAAGAAATATVLLDDGHFMCSNEHGYKGAANYMSIIHDGKCTFSPCAVCLR